MLYGAECFIQCICLTEEVFIILLYIHEHFSFPMIPYNSPSEGQCFASKFKAIIDESRHSSIIGTSWNSVLAGILDMCYLLP